MTQPFDLNKQASRSYLIDGALMFEYRFLVPLEAILSLNSEYVSRISVMSIVLFAMLIIFSDSRIRSVLAFRGRYLMRFNASLEGMGDHPLDKRQVISRRRFLGCSSITRSR